ncbi:MAG: hypothetical protein AB7F89_13425 [Pirellulaceae bacterium]
MKSRMTCALFALLVLVMSHVSAQMPDDIRKHFNDHLVGRWATEVTHGDWKQTGLATINWNPGGQSLNNLWQVRDAQGAIHITELIGWDDASSTVVVQGFDSQGNTWTIHWNRPTADKLNDWSGRGVGTYENKPWESSTKMQFSGDSYRYEDTTGGKPLVLVAKRKDSDEQAYRAWFEYLAGTWDAEEGPGNTGTVTFRSTGAAPGISFQVDLRDYAIAGVLGWNGESRLLVETDYFANRQGVTGTMQREYFEITRDSLKGRGTFRFSDGVTGNGSIEYRRIGDNDMVLAGTDFDGTQWTAKFKRAR